MAVCVLSGAMPFFKDLIFQLPPEISTDYLKISSYGDQTTSSGEAKLQHNISLNPEGKDILIIEDIVDTGISMEFLLKFFADKKAKSVKICTLFYKSVNNRSKIVPD